MVEVCEGDLDCTELCEGDLIIFLSKEKNKTCCNFPPLSVTENLNNSCLLTQLNTDHERKFKYLMFPNKKLAGSMKIDCRNRAKYFLPAGRATSL